MHESEQELRPCPFCGKAAELIGITMTQIRCTNDQCITRGAFNFYNHRQDAIAAWNTRPAEAELVEALEEILNIRPMWEGGVRRPSAANLEQTLENMRDVARAALSRARSKDEVASDV